MSLLILKGTARHTGWLWSLALAGVMVGIAGELSWKTGEGYRWAELEVTEGGHTGFRRMTLAETGIAFTNVLQDLEGAANRVLFNGSGLAAGDYDGDGRVDLYVCGLNTPNVLYRNLGGWRFEDVTEAAGASLPGKHYRGAAFADLNGDGALDLLVSTTGQGTLVLQNDGAGRFRDVTSEAGTGSDRGSVTMALADVDGDGTVDLYITNNRKNDIRDRGRVQVGMRNGELVLPPDLQDRLILMGGTVQEVGEPDQLLLNDGEGHFTEVAWTDGGFVDEAGRSLREIPRDWGLTGTFRDLNGDGAPDLYICNDYWSPDRIWINDGRGRFRALEAFAIRHTSASSMGVDITDIDHDGHPDIYVLDMLSRDVRLRRRQMLAQDPGIAPPGLHADRPQVMRNTLLLNRGDTTFADVADYAGIPASDWSWSPVFLDVDLDGFEDLLIPAGHTKDVQDLDADLAIQARQRSYDQYTDEQERQRAFTHDKMLNARLYPLLEMPIVAFRNLGGARFEEVTDRWGTADLGVHHGIAVGDLDNDGDLDFAVNNQNSNLGVYRNESGAPRVAVRLKGEPPNTQGVGAKVTLLGGAVPAQTKEVIVGGRYLAGADPQVMFAAGSGKRDLQLEIIWRSGRRSIVNHVRANCLYEVQERGALASAPAPSAAETPTWFEDVSERLGAEHEDEMFDDFSRQPLLPRKLSQGGPGLAWFDLNGDQFEDLVVGAGKTGQLGVYRGDGKGGFSADRNSPVPTPVTRDHTAVLAYQNAASNRVVLVGTANYEDGVVLGPAAREYNFATGRVRDAVPATPSSTGPMALADFNGDGVLDLFVGGRVRHKRWPEPCSSRLLLGNGDDFRPDPETDALFQDIGLVSGALWADLDANGWPELILACEFGPVRVFENREGHLEERTEALGLAAHSGWWNSVAAGDLDGDGQIDLVAGNWGLNSPYRIPATRALPVYIADFDEDGSVEILETEWDAERDVLVPLRMRDPLMQVMPYLVEPFSTYQAYSEASIEDLLGEFKVQTSLLSVQTLATTVFLRRGDRFEASPLPPEAQWAPVQGLAIADFDGDGRDDLFLAQNFFATRPGMPRLDAGRGLLLRNAGEGRFEAVPGQESGLTIYGEQRGTAVADFDQDGRVDLAVGQNAASVRLFRNVTAAPGLRCRVEGVGANPLGVGTVLRWVPDAGTPQQREIRLGSGYWSQDSVVPVLGVAGRPARLEVTLPGGKIRREYRIPETAREVWVRASGDVRWR